MKFSAIGKKKSLFGTLFSGLGPRSNISLSKVYFLHLKNSHLVFGSPTLPSPLAQHQNCRPQFGPFFLTVLSSASSRWPGQSGVAGGFFIKLFHASEAWKQIYKIHIWGDLVYDCYFCMYFFLMWTSHCGKSSFWSPSMICISFIVYHIQYTIFAAR